MDSRTGNLTAAERAALKRGTCVVWQRERGDEKTGTVYGGTTDGTVIMQDCGIVGTRAFLRLADWTPASAPQ